MELEYVNTNKRPLPTDDTSTCPFTNVNKKAKIESTSVNRNDFIENHNNDSTDDSMKMDEDSNQNSNEGEFKEGENNDDSQMPYEDESDIDELLEADVDDALKEEKGEYTVLEKLVLKRKQRDIFNVLPDNWIEVTHDSGLPVYLHRSTRVVTFGRPYFLGPGSVKHHKVPSSAIPCFYQRKMIEEEEKNKKDQETQVENATDEKTEVLQQLNAPALEVKSTEDMAAADLTPTELNEYASNLFEFKKITYKKFKDWKKARAYFKELKKLSYHKNQLMSQKERPMLPSDTKIITVPGMEAVSKPSTKEFRMNPAHKSALTVLHEYVQKVLKSSIEYDAISTGDPTMPYCAIAKIRASKVATAVIEEHNYRERFAVVQEEYKARLTEEGREESDIEKCLKDMIVVGRGLGKGKKAAKMNAAAVALKLLIPDVYFDDQGIARTSDPILDEVNKVSEELAIFDELEIENTMIPELSTKTGQPMPFVILQECLTKCAPVANCKLETICEKVSHTTVAYTLKIGNFSVTTTGTKKLECKQHAAQKVLSKLYPNFRSYGAILRLYGTHIKRQMKDLRLENKEFQKQNIASRASVNKTGTKKVESTGRFLESVMNHMIKFAEKASNVEDDITNRSSMLTKKTAEELAKKSEEKSMKEGDHFLETIPKVWTLE